MKLIEVDGITKRYKRYRKPYHVLFEKAHLMRPVETTTALDNVSFEAAKGESIALVGSNGAGKTTLLKIILGITRQTAGHVVVDGKLTAMIVIGLGMDDFFSGRYNIHLFGTILGMSKQEIDEKFDKIVAFAGLEKHIHMPLRTYSRGMRVRLAFSVMMHVETDCYVIDETLAFADIPFRKLCIRKLKEHRDNGATLIVASHDPYLINELSDRVLWIRDGRIVDDGPPATVLDRYERSHDHQSVREYNEE